MNKRDISTHHKQGGLSRDRIELAALELIEQVGLEDFSMRNLGKTLGCEPMSLYHYFSNKAELFNALVDRIISHFRFPESDLSGPEVIRRLANEWRNMALSHPKFFPFIALHRLNSEAGVGFLNRILELLQKLGLAPEEASRFFRVVNYFLIGAALDETAGYSKGSSALKPVGDDRIVKNYPALAACSQWFSETHFQSTFEFGLQLLLGERRIQLRDRSSLPKTHSSGRSNNA